MTYEERNNIVLETIASIKVIHDRYTSSSKLLNDDEWQKYIDDMLLIPERFRNTNLQDFIGELVMTFLNDTERMQKKLRKLKELK